MKKQKLIVFAGKPAVGKTTLIALLAHNAPVVNVWHFLEPLVAPGSEVPPEEKNILGYEAMYTHLGTLTDPVVFLEIGTNYPDFNVAQLSQLSTQYDIDIVLCDASKDVCRERGVMRGKRLGNGFDERLERDFPNTFLQQCTQTPLRHFILNNEGTPEEACTVLQEKLPYLSL